MGSGWLPPRGYGSVEPPDAARHDIVLFGGRGSLTRDPLGDTWIWDGATWTEVGPPIGMAGVSGPVARLA
jgi:hypothetical protein